MNRPRKKYSASVRKIVRDAKRIARRLKREGWTREDFVKALNSPPLEGESATEHLARVSGSARS